MSLDNNHLCRFGDFTFDATEKVLMCEGKPVALTPKALKLLRVLISNCGHIIEKETLMNEVWADSFVEESNLTFTISQLRKTLGDNAQNPVYIETVPRRGYRFIHEVTDVSDENDSTEELNDVTELPPSGENSTIGNKSKPKKYLIPALAAGIFLIGTTIFGVWYAGSKNQIVSSSILSAPFSSEKISTNGKVFHAVITANGKNVIYTNKSGKKQSVWLRQLDSSNNIEIVPASEDVYAGLAVSPDGNFLYFSRKSKDSQQHLNIYRASIYGGVPNQIAADTQGWISVSPDGTKVSFVRCNYREVENCSLWIADAADGKNEKKIASRKPPFRIADNQFSPDGKSVAFAVGQSENSSNDFGLMTVNIETGEEREITKEKFFNIKGVAWLPDKSGLLITASRIQNKNFLIWRVFADSGAVEPLTNDSQTYSALSLDETASRLIGTTVREDFRLNLINVENASDKKVLFDASTSNFAPDGKIIFSSTATGNEEIWSINVDGSGQKQLTNDSADDSKPVGSPSDNVIYFASNRSGTVQIWRMNADGSNQTQFTTSEGGYPLLVTPDGQYVYYQHGLDKSLRRVSKDGKMTETLWEKGAYRFAVSPDGTKAAFVEKSSSGRILKIISTADKKTVEIFQPAVAEYKMPEVAWMPDGKSLVYILMDENYENHSLWLQPLGGQQPQKISDLGDEEIAESSGFSVSPDGKSVAYIQGGWRHDAVLLKGLR